jgi:predicted nucleic acid-binding protein
VIICDTGALVALLNAADDYHAACSNLFATYPGRLIVPGPILTEVCYMAESRLGSETEALFLDSLASGEFELEAVDASDLARMAELVRRYADFPLGAADASVVAVAERLKTARIATLDHRHFRVVRPAHCDAFELLPARS